MDIEKQIKEIIQIIDSNNASINDTPRRVSSAYDEFFSGYSQNLSDIANVTFDSEMNDIIMLKDIPFTSQCEHHMAPIIGHATVGYIPKGKIIGASKIARIVDCFANRLQLQERMTVEIAKAIDSILDTDGVAVYVEAEHFCISKRGVKKSGAKFITRYFLKSFNTNKALRTEFLHSIS